ncbi:Transducin beta-like protein 2 [Hordeum vulgare]|nr:Transducin beta-like protein 2 [Hordeum vulgare]
MLLGGAIAFVFLAGYLRRKRADIAHVPPSAVAAARTCPSRSAPPRRTRRDGPSTTTPPPPTRSTPISSCLHPHLARAHTAHSNGIHDSAHEAAKKHHHLDVNTLRGHTDCVTALDFSSDACNLTTGEPTLRLPFDQDLSCLRTETF